MPSGLVVIALFGALALAPQGAVAGVRAAVSVVVSPVTGPPTTVVTVSAAGFRPFERVDVYIDNFSIPMLGSFKAGATGSGSTQVTIPKWAKPKTHYILIARGHTSKRLAFARFLVETSWLQAGFDSARHGFNPYENVLNRRTVATLHSVWRIPAHNGAVVAYGMVYVGNSYNPTLGLPAKLSAYDAVTGRPRWTTEVTPPGGAPGGTPAVSNGMVYIASDQEMSGSRGWGYLSAVNAFTGRLMWSVPLAGVAPVAGWYFDQSPVIANGLVLAARGGVYDARTGALRWVIPDLEQCDYNGMPSDSWYGDSFTMANGFVYYRCVINGKIEVRNAATGSLVSEFRGAARGSVPIVQNGVMYQGAGAQVVAQDAATGTVRWAAAVAAPAGQPAIANGVVYVSVGSYDLMAFDANTGHVRWKNHLGVASDVPPSVPVIANGVVYVQEGHLLRAFDAIGGKLLRTAITSNGAFGRVTVANGIVYGPGEAFAK